MIAFFKKPFGIAVGIVAILAVIGLIFFFSGGKKTDQQTAVVQKGTIVQEVSVTGTVKPAESLDLAFQTSGKLKRMNVDVGDSVSAGQVLAQLDGAELAASVAQYQAALASQQAKLDELKRGSRLEEIQITRSALEKAQQDLTNYYDSVMDTLSDAYNKADDAARTKTAAILTKYTTTNYSLSFNSCDSQAQIDAAQSRATMENLLTQWQSELAVLTSSATQPQKDGALQKAAVYLAQVKTFLDRVNDTLVGGCSLTATTLDTYRTSVNTARTNTVTALTSVSDLRQYIAVQKITVQKAQDELNLDLAGSTPEAIAAQEALVKQAAANVQSAEARLAQTVITAPITGTVTQKNSSEGEIVAANSTVVAMISNSNMEIKADVPEVDVAKIQVANSATVTLDAYGNDLEFTAKVAKIDPAETIISGVTYYKTTLVFESTDERVKPGMTANVVILAAKKEGVLYVPQRAVLMENGNIFVRVADSKDQSKYEKKEVKTGLTGSAGQVEILSGLKEGEIVITYLKTNGN
jgi:HlyD family secretion protein